MKKDPYIFLEHILDFIEDIESYIGDRTKVGFLANEMMQDAVIRKIEIIGEAAKNIPAGFTSKHSAIPWSDIAGMRDKLIHHYFGVDLDKVWGVVKDDLPKLKKQIQKLLEERD